MEFMDESQGEDEMWRIRDAREDILIIMSNYTTRSNNSIYQTHAGMYYNVADVSDI